MTLPPVDKKILLFLIIVVILFIIFVVIRIIYRLRVIRGDRYADEMDGLEYENYCADLLREQGFTHVEITPGSGDFGADILAQKDGISYAFQCKYYDKPVGVHAVQEIYAGRDFYGCMVGAVITNCEFTAPARELADRLNILLWEKV